MYGNSKGQSVTYADSDQYHRDYQGQQPQSIQSQAYYYSPNDSNKSQYGPGVTSMSRQNHYARTSNGYAEGPVYQSHSMSRDPSSQSTSTNGSSPRSPGSYKAKEKPYHCIEPGCMSPKGGLTSFARRDELTRHYQTHRGEDRELFACPVAGCNRSGAYGLPRRDKLNDHLRTVHKMSNQAIRY